MGCTHQAEELGSSWAQAVAQSGQAAIVPAGTSFPPVRELCDLLIARYAAASFVDQLNSVPSTHMRCRMTASLRATATVALRSPFRLASLIPQAFSADHFGTRVSNTPAASKR